MTARIAEAPRLSVNALLRPAAPPPFPLDHDGVTLWYSARVALWQGVRALGLRAGDRVLVPAYTCGSEVDALLKAGLALEFYRIRPDLSPDLDHVAGLCAMPARALLVTHFFGVAQPMAPILGLVQERELLLIEDNAHGLYSTDPEGRPLGSFGDMAVFSFGKMLPLPDGGGLVLRPGRVTSGSALTGRRPDALRVAGKVKYLVREAIASRHPALTRAVTRVALDPLVAGLKAVVYGERRSRGGGDDESEMRRVMELSPSRVDWAMSSLARRLLARTPHAAVQKRRVHNFEALRARFAGGPRVSPLLSRLPDGSCPLFFPVQVDDADGLRRFLAARRVGCIRFWSVFHEAFPRERFPFETALKLSVLGLPIHQDLGDDDMAYLGDLLDRWERGDP